MDLRVYNTLTRQKVPLRPLEPGKLGIYVCGPTVYSFVHIGNARTFTSFDTIVRYLRSRGFQVRYVRNYTDVDDKIIKAAAESGESAQALAERFIAAFEEDAQALRLLPPDVAPRVSQTMPEIIALIGRLIERKVAYQGGGDVYFEVSAWAPYLELSGRKLDELEAGGGERELHNDCKRSPFDFALWKAAKPGEPSWDSPWGPGRPGWHIECSAMSEKYLGQSFDLHGGGLDLIFPHHENERAQSESANGVQLCSCWMHGGFLDLDGAKMSKSLGNVVRLRDALAQVDAEALRYFFLSTHYRQKLAFSDKSLHDAEGRLEYFYETLARTDAALAVPSAAPQGPLQVDVAQLEAQFHEAMSDDFNVPGALATVSAVFQELNALLDRPKAKDRALALGTLSALRVLVSSFGQALGLFVDQPGDWLLRRRARLVRRRGLDEAWIAERLAARQAARALKTKEGFAVSDAIRAELLERGVEVMDGPAGTTWKVAAGPA